MATSIGLFPNPQQGDTMPPRGKRVKTQDGKRYPQLPDLEIEDADVRWWNLTGRPQGLNPEGKRTFTIFLSNELAEQLSKDGWNVRMVSNRNDDDQEDQPVLNVEARYDIKPPQIYMVGYGRNQLLNEETVGLLDDVEKTSVDLIVFPYRWTMNDRTGIKAYVKLMYVNIKENRISRKYADMKPD